MVLGDLGWFAHGGHMVCRRWAAAFGERAEAMLESVFRLRGERPSVSVRAPVGLWRLEAGLARLVAARRDGGGLLQSGAAASEASAEPASAVPTVSHSTRATLRVSRLNSTPTK